MFEYEITAKAGNARAGIFHTPHGELLTPVFAPVGTQVTVRTLNPAQIVEPDIRRLRPLAQFREAIISLIDWMASIYYHYALYAAVSNPPVLFSDKDLIGGILLDAFVRF
jgi:hypothetical protein